MKRRQVKLCPVLVGVAVLLLSAAMAEAAFVTVPASLTFQVTDPSSATQGTPNPFVVSFGSHTPFGDGYVQISVRAESLGFTPSYPGLDASDVTWTALLAAGGTGVPGTLDTSFRPVFVGWPLQVNGDVHLIWSLAPLPAGTPSGTYILVLDWAFEVIDSGGPGL